MMEFEDIMIQLVDAPPISPGHTDRAVVGLARYADAVALVLDASDDALLEHIEGIRSELAKSRVVLTGDSGDHADLPEGTVARPAIVVANKADAPNANGNLDVLREFYSDEFSIKAVSALKGDGLEELRSAFFGVLGIIRVYTKMPGKPPDMDRPFTMRRGSTLLDLAATVHKDFAHSLRMAKAWGKNTLDGAQIGRDHVLEDRYIVELHA